LTLKRTESNEFYDEKIQFKANLVSLLAQLKQMENLVEFNNAKLVEEFRLQIL
jgi:hypothetical protein